MSYYNKSTYTIKVFYFGLAFLFLWSCKNNNSADQSKPKSTNPYVDAIQNSSTADNPNDSSHVAKIHLLENDFNFGTIKKTDTFRHNFKFVNTGNARLLISTVNGTCGCTTAEFPKGFILPQDTGIIKVTFIPDNKLGDQDKPITITANTKPNTTIIQFKGKVLPK
ncbi:MAG: DUF1573 domain-containing protein [Saprospiraceae bacterium]|nr:DUF1573 domain-containing protein [Saprospiraceae bacterium]